MAKRQKVSVPFRGFYISNSLASRSSRTQQIVSVPFRGFYISNNINSFRQNHFRRVSVPFRGFYISNTLPHNPLFMQFKNNVCGGNLFSLDSQQLFTQKNTKNPASMRRVAKSIILALSSLFCIYPSALFSLDNMYTS